ncbi:MAG TPA: FecR domain-containing protein [Syntrophales bacterium]|nr:FecR domain-containing protein [Syntrophales bacterium]HQB31330.1 FecR domain-containing protein [Syntrophales bacterium]HQN79257.1 FecR domain-containing protein [Syntrophales bacterium]HQQ28498.1 FecR domain-containing protein [Syntrophales bacterium]
MTRDFRLFLLVWILLPVLLLPAAGRADEERTVRVTVVRNDNLYNICRKYLEFSSDWPEIGRINGLRNMDLIHPGQTLILPVRLLKGVPVDGMVIFVKGDVSVRSAVWRSWTALWPGDRVRQGNQIRTGPESAVEITFENGTTLLQRSDTVLGLKSSQNKGGASIFQRLTVPAGRLLMKVRRATGQDSRMEIHTPSATAAARGTDFRVSVDARESTTAEVLQGEVDVSAMKRTVALKGGEGTFVGKGSPPLPPRKLLPPPSPVDLEDLYRKMPFEIRFDRVEGAAACRFQLSKDREGKDVVREKVVDAGKPLELDGLEDGTYHLQGRSIEKTGIEGLPSTVLPVRVRVNPLPPFIQGPAAGARIKGRSVSFRWLRVRDAVRYRLQISRDGEFADLLRDLADLREVSREEAFDDYGTCHFRVRSIAADGFEGNWSDAAVFTLVPPPPAPPLEVPGMGEGELRIRWRDQGEGLSYRCQISREEGFGKLFFEKIVDRPEIVVPGPEDPGFYYVRVSAIDPTGYEGGFSPPQSFEVWPPPIETDWAGAFVMGTVALLLVLLL